MIKIDKVNFGYKQFGVSYDFGNPGASAPCNINANCAGGNGWDNEKNSIAIIVVDGAEQCTGSLIMNSCNTNIPYFLTANHCLDAGNLPNWVFQFQTLSTDCATNTGWREDIQFNGCTLRANSAITDFALLQLNNTPPVNSGLFYSGWSRQTTGNTSTTILHHPAGDLMKISRDINAPVTLNSLNREVWQLDLDLGIVQGGSSGAPYYNQNHQIIGQHFRRPDALILPVCNITVTHGGRFNVSWTGGGTNATRLSNWLDPNNLGNITTTTTNVANLVTPINLGNPAILGAGVFCNTASYSIPNLPANTTVIWSVPAAVSGTFSVAQNTPVANQCTITMLNTAVLSTTLTATIAPTGSACGIIRTLPISTNQAFPYTTCSGGSGIVRTASFPTLVPSNCTISVSLNLSPGASVVYTSQGGGPNNVPPTFWNYSTATGMLSFQIPFGVNGVAVSFTISNNNCSNGLISFYAFSSGGRFSFTAAPNPVQQTLLVNASEVQSTENSEAVALTAIEKAALQFTMNVYDIHNNTLLLTQRSSKGSMQQRLNVSKLKTGYYVLEIIEGINKQSIKFFKE